MSPAKDLSGGRGAAGAPLRVAVVGTGGIAQMMHLPTLAERPDLFRVTALADVDRTVLEAVGARYGITTLATDYRELLTRRDVEAVLFATTGSHREAVVRALRAGKHVFVEKPLAFSLAETEDVARTARRSRTVLMIGYHKRYDPHYRRAREEVRSMRDLRLVQASVLHPDDAAYRTHHPVLPLRPFAERPEEVLDRILEAEALEGPTASALRETAGGVASPARLVATSMLWQSLIHDVNALRGILGEPAEVLQAHCWRHGLAQTSLTRFAGNVRVLLSWVSLPGLKHYEERLSFVSPEKRVTLTFPSPYLRHFPTPLVVERMEGGEHREEHLTASYEEAFRAELHHFRDCVRHGRKPETGIEDALGDARWIQAIARALAPPAASPKPGPPAPSSKAAQPPQSSPRPAKKRSRRAPPKPRKAPPKSRRAATRPKRRAAKPRSHRKRSR